MTCIIQLSQTIYSDKLVAFNVTLDHLQSDQSLSYLLNFFSRNRSLTRKHQLLHYPHALRFQNKEETNKMFKEKSTKYNNVKNFKKITSLRKLVTSGLASVEYD